jgi:predicted AlkP superfamily phosphohydrolase/phosphomutase
VLIRQGSKEAARAVASATLKPVEAAETTRHFSPRFRVAKGNVFGYTYFRLFSLAPDGHMLLYQRGASGRSANEPKERTRHLEAVGGYFAVPFDLYEKGELGPTLWQSGDGTAERRLLECVRLDSEFLQQGVRYALRQWHPDLLFHYIPTTDELGHTWMGALDPDSLCYKEDLARRLWPYYAAVYQILDEGLGDILDQIDRDTVVCLVSDHGMAGTSRMVSLNVILEKAGLLARTPDNRIDLARTRICAPAWSSYFLVVNGTDWKQGIVPPAEREAVLRAATEALLATTDPLTNRHIVTGVFRPDQTVGLGIGGPAGGDLYLDLTPGYEPTNQLTTDTLWTWPSLIGGGAHGFWPLRTKMQAICFIGGAGVVPGRRIPGMRAIDFAPTLARLLGVPAPRDARGHALADVLTVPSRRP